MFKPIVPKPFRADRITAAVLQALVEEVQDIGADFDEATKTWKHDPAFKREIVTTAGNLRGMVFSYDDILRYVSRGTRIRYATMSRDWRSKTRPRSLKTGAGRGRMLFVSRKRPRPGIEARDWEPLISARVQKRFPGRVAKYIKMGADHAFD